MVCEINGRLIYWNGLRLFDCLLKVMWFDKSQRISVGNGKKMQKGIFVFWRAKCK